MSGKLYLCATPIGNLNDLTYRCVEVLKNVDLIAAEDTRHTLKLLNHLGIEKPMTSYFEHNRKEKGEHLINEMLSGKNIALVSDAGTPAISDPGEDLVALCAEHGVQVVPIPGCVAAINALIVSGLPTGRFSFEGFLTTNRSKRREHLEDVKGLSHTLIFYEAPHKLLSTLKDMLDIFGNRRITLCRELTKLHEEIRRTDLEGALSYYENTPPRGEFVLILEGAQKANVLEEQRQQWNAFTVEEHIEHYLEQGITEKQAIKNVAQDRGVPKRDIYAQYKIKE